MELSIHLPSPLAALAHLPFAPMAHGPLCPPSISISISISWSTALLAPPKAPLVPGRGPIAAKPTYSVFLLPLGRPGLFFAGVVSALNAGFLKETTFLSDLAFLQYCLFLPAAHLQAGGLQADLPTPWQAEAFFLAPAIC